MGLRYFFKQLLLPPGGLLLLLLLAAAVFAYFAPLTYGWPLTTAQMEQRLWFDVWRLEPVR